jgi:hypothetical protein
MDFMGVDAIGLMIDGFMDYSVEEPADCLASPTILNGLHPKPVSRRFHPLKQ